MSTDLASAIDAWRDAVAEAQAAEKLLDQTWQDYLARRGPAATDGLIKEVTRFRGRAETRLMFALALMNSDGAGPRSMSLKFMDRKTDVRAISKEQAFAASAG